MEPIVHTIEITFTNLITLNRNLFLSELNYQKNMKISK